MYVIYLKKCLECKQSIDNKISAVKMEHMFIMIQGTAIFCLIVEKDHYQMCSTSKCVLIYDERIHLIVFFIYAYIKHKLYIFQTHILIFYLCKPIEHCDSENQNTFRMFFPLHFIKNQR